MYYKWIGAAFVITGCAGTGLSIASNYQQEEKAMQQLIRILDYMKCELQYKLTPLPELCRLAASQASGVLRDILSYAACEMDQQISLDACSCLTAAIQSCREVPLSLRKHLLELGQTLGRFDLPGQINGLLAAKEACELDLKLLSKEKDNRIHSYQILGICAGIALVILLV